MRNRQKLASELAYYRASSSRRIACLGERGTRRHRVDSGLVRELNQSTRSTNKDSDLRTENPLQLSLVLPPTKDTSDLAILA